MSKRGKNKKALAALLLAALCLCTLPAPVAASQADELGLPPATVLVVCASETDARLLADLSAAAGRRADIVAEGDFVAALLEDRDYLITDVPAVQQAAANFAGGQLLLGTHVDGGEVTFGFDHNAGVVVSVDSHTGIERFEARVGYVASGGGSAYGHVEVQGGRYPFAVSQGTNTYVPYYRHDDLSTLMLGGVVRSLLGQPGKGSAYVLLDEVYAFSDLAALCDTADILYQNALPFIVRITPMYDNLDYPAFARYAQMLRYIQARNGTVVLGQALIEYSAHVREPLADKLKRLRGALEEEGVAYIESDHLPLVTDVGLLEAIQPTGKAFGAPPCDVMVRFPLLQDEASRADAVDRLGRLWLSIGDYRRNYDDLHYQYREEAIDEDHVYREEEDRLFSAQFALGDRVLIGVVSVALLILVVLIGFGVRAYRRKFLAK